MMFNFIKRGAKLFFEIIDCKTTVLNYLPKLTHDLVVNLTMNLNCNLSSIVIYMCALILGGTLISCSPAPKSSMQDSLTKVATTQAKRFTIRPGDELSIRFYATPELSDETQVQPDGIINLSLVGSVLAAGKTPAELSQELRRLYAKELRDPRVTVAMRNLRDYKIFVGGEVNNPQVISFTPDMTPIQAVFAAGGFTKSARISQIVVVSRGNDLKPISHRIDLRDPAASTDFPLSPLDIVYVPRTAIAGAQSFVDNYIRKLLLFQGIGISFGYDLNDNDN